MIGICGVFQPGGSVPQAPDALHEMGSASAGRGPETPPHRQAFTAPRVAIAAIGGSSADSGVAERTVDGAPVVLAFCGSADGTGTGASRSGEVPSRAGLLLDRYLARGLAVLAEFPDAVTLAIWDGRTGALTIATDRFRVHPIVYARDGDAFVFATSMAGLRASPIPLRLSIEPGAILDVIGSSIIPTPNTIYREVRKCPPAHRLTVRQGTFELEPYWDLDFTRSRAEPEPVLAQGVRERLESAIRTRVEGVAAGQELGAFLSGGVDSSTVTGLLARVTGRKVKTFSIGFAERDFDEIGYARIAARHFDTEHHEYRVTAEDVLEAIPRVVEGFDEPFGNASAVPTYYCARLAREQGVRVLFAGDGGDELFAGNKRYAQQRLFDYYTSLPGPLRDGILPPLVAGLAKALPGSPFLWGRKYIARARIPLPERLTSYGFYRTEPIPDLFRPEFLAEVPRDYLPFEAFHRHYRGARASHPLTRQLYTDLKIAISDNDLPKVTRMTSAAGVAVHFPFLDHRLTDYAQGIPPRLLMRGRHLRTFFKKAYADFLPIETARKSKHGFGLPIPGWLREHPRLRELMLDHLLGPSAQVQSYLRREAIERLVARHGEDPTSFYGTALWNILVLELWLRRYGR